MFHFVVIFLSVFSLSATQSGIVGGKTVAPHSRPYMVSLQVEGNHVCGGILIREDYVLTVAHCKAPKPLQVVLGAHNIMKRERTQQRLEVKSYHPHPKYDVNLHKNDIMLLKLKTKAKQTEYVKVRRPPQHNKKLNKNSKCVIAGWGLSSSSNKRPESLLREVSLELETVRNCKAKWQQYFDGNLMMCSISNGKQAFCQGDSGGPLVCDSRAVGLASYTFPDQCTNDTYPEVYTRISHYLPWIKKVMLKKT